MIFLPSIIIIYILLHNLNYPPIYYGTSDFYEYRQLYLASQIDVTFLFDAWRLFYLTVEKFLGEVYDNPDDKNWSSPRPMSVQFEDIDDPGEVR